MSKITLLISIVLSISLSFAKSEKLVLAGDIDFAPFSYLNNKKPVGIDIDIAKQAAKRLNIEIDIKLFPWKRTLTSIKKGLADLGMALFRTSEREEYAEYTHPVHYSDFVLFVKKREGV